LHPPNPKTWKRVVPKRRVLNKERRKRGANKKGREVYEVADDCAQITMIITQNLLKNVCAISLSLWHNVFLVVMCEREREKEERD